MTRPGSLEFELKKQEQFRKTISENLERCRTLAAGAKTEFWKQVKEIVKAKLDFEEERLDNFWKMTQDERAACLQSRLDLKYFYGMADNFASEMDRFAKALADTNNRISELKEAIRERNRRELGR